MRNLKKTLAVVLAFAMILSMGLTSMAAYSDVTAGTVVSEAVDVLSGLNILTGFEDGTFKPEETVTRAQMAAIICRMLGYEDQAKSSMGSTIFNDVAADHWASGYINVAQAQQIINGYGDGNYGPEDLVTYEQAVKMIVSALGYDLAAAAKGGYPTGYLAIASAEGITKKANGTVGDAAKRGTIAVLAYNALEVPLFEQDSWSTDGTDSYSYAADNILTRYLDIRKWEAVVTATPATGIARNGYDSTLTAKVSMTGKKWDFVDNYNRWTYQLGSEKDITVNADKVDTNAFLGKSVVAYIGEDEVTGVDTVYAIAETVTKNASLKVSVTQLAKDGDKYFSDDNVVGYKEAGSSRIKDLLLDDAAQAYVNFKSTGLATNNTEGIRGKVTAGTVEFVSNDGDDGDYEIIIITSYNKGEAVIKNVEEKNGVYGFETYVGNIQKIDTEDDDVLTVVYKDGAEATVADIAANDTVSIAEVYKKGFYIYYVSSATVTGLVESYEDGENIVTIAGTDYEISGNCPRDAKQLSGEEGIFFLNVDGQIAYNETAPTSSGKYALVVAAYDHSDGINSGSYIQVVLADGTVAEYKIADNASIYSYENKYISKQDGEEWEDGDSDDDKIDTKAEFKAYFANQMAITDGDAKKATADDLYDDANHFLVKLNVSNGKVTKAKLLENPDGIQIDDKEYDAIANTVGNKTVDEGTVVFSIAEAYDNSSEAVDVDDIKVGTIADFLVDEVKCYAIVFDMDTTGTYGALIGFNLAQPIVDENAVFVVTSKKTTTIDDAEAVVFTGIRAGEEETITVYDEDGVYTTTPSTIKVGDVIITAEADEEGIVSDVKSLFAFNYDTPASSAGLNTCVSPDEDSDIYSGYGKASAVETTSGVYSNSQFSIDQAITNDYDTTTDEVDADEAITYVSGANYTLVDFSESKKPEISAEGPGKYFIDPEYVTYAYVRYVDGKLADVVAYRLSVPAATEITISDLAVTVGDTVTVTITGMVSGAECTIDANNDASVNNTAKTVTINEEGTTKVTVLVEKEGYADKKVTFNVVATAADPS